MEKSRRNFLIAGAVLIGGCQGSSRTSNVPGVHWPASARRPMPGDGAYVPKNAAPAPRSSASRSAGLSGDGTASNPIARSSWAGGGPSRTNINPMGGINRITIHHEGLPQAINFTDVRATASHLEMVRNSHRNRGWADIGYHFIIDRAGRVWEGRPLQYQGAHVRNNNEHNVGIMVLGNFEIQQPSDAQFSTLDDAVRQIRRRFRVAQRSIFTHQELTATACPGRNLQPRIASMRSNGKFA